jgi:hypothetical protein
LLTISKKLVVESKGVEELIIFVDETVAKEVIVEGPSVSHVDSEVEVG